jgi:hypothetical protein
MTLSTASKAKALSATSKEVTTLAEYIRRVERRKPNAKQVNLYRGHNMKGHILQPSLFRVASNRKHEKNILRELVSIHPSEFASDRGVFEQLVRMQHYSLPTRLLDLTSNPLVALYFCCVTRLESPGEVVRIIANAETVRYYDSDTVSCVANLANLSGRERTDLRKTRTDADVSASEAGKRLLQFIKAEKPYFNPEIQREHLSAPLAVKPRLSNRRLLAQQGAFLLFGLDTKLEDENRYGFRIVRIGVPADAKPKIRESLDKIGINESTMFPEIESAARYIMSKVTPTIEEEDDA